MKEITFSAKSVPIGKFFNQVKDKVVEVLTEYPNNYVEVSVTFCIGDVTNASCVINVEEGELKQKTRSFKGNE